MFNDLLTKCVQPKKILWETPTKITMDIDNDDGMRTYDLLKGAEEFLHTQIGVKTSTSKELYKKEHELWKEFRDARLDECANRENEIDRFSLDKSTVYYLINDSGEIVDIVDLKKEEYVDEFLDSHQQFNLHLAGREVVSKMLEDCKNGLTKIVCYMTKDNVLDKKYTPVLMLEFNAKKSKYKVYRGVFMYKSFTFIPAFTPDIEKDSLAELIKVFDIIEQLENADDRKEDLIDYYEKFSDVPVEVSVRELLHYFKRVGYIPNIDERDLVADIENVSDEVNVIKLQEFFNTFTTGETARDILGLSEFKKTFRYNKLTMLDVLEILSKEYLTETGSKITATVLGDLIYVVLDTKKTDRFQVDNLKLNN